MDTDWDINAKHASLRMSIDPDISHKCIFYSSGLCHFFMTQDMGMGWDNTLFHPGRFDYKESFIATSKTDKERAGARC